MVTFRSHFQHYKVKAISYPSRSFYSPPRHTKQAVALQIVNAIYLAKQGGKRAKGRKKPTVVANNVGLLHVFRGFISYSRQERRCVHPDVCRHPCHPSGDETLLCYFTRIHSLPSTNSRSFYLSCELCKFKAIMSRKT